MINGTILREHKESSNNYLSEDLFRLQLLEQNMDMSLVILEHSYINESMDSIKEKLNKAKDIIIKFIKTVFDKIIKAFNRMLDFFRKAGEAKEMKDKGIVIKDVEVITFNNIGMDLGNKVLDKLKFSDHLDKVTNDISYDYPYKSNSAFCSKLTNDIFGKSVSSLSDINSDLISNSVTRTITINDLNIDINDILYEGFSDVIIKGYIDECTNIKKRLITQTELIYDKIKMNVEKDERYRVVYKYLSNEAKTLGRIVTMSAETVNAVVLNKLHIKDLIDKCRHDMNQKKNERR